MRRNTAYITAFIKKTAGRINPNYLLKSVSIILAFLALAVPVISIERAHWISPQPSLITTITLAAVSAVLISNRRVPDRARTPAAFIIAGIVIIWQTVLLFPGGETSRFYQLWQQVKSLSLNEATVFFTVFLLIVTWLGGFVSIWYITRHRNPWVAFITGTLVLIINLSNLPRDDYFYFIIYFPLAIAALGAGQLARKNAGLNKWSGKNVRRGVAYFSVSLAGIAILTSGAAYVIPSPPIDNFGLKANINPTNVWFNIFNSIPSKWSLIKSEPVQKVQFKDSPSDMATIHFLVDAPQPDYWPTRYYDIYAGSGWTSIVTDKPAGNPEISIEHTANVSDIKSINYTVKSFIKTDVILEKGQVISASIPVKLRAFSDNTGVLLANDVPDIAAVSSEQMIRPYQSYRVESSIITASPEELEKAGDKYPEWIRERYLQLPPDFPEEIRVVSQRLTGEAVTNYDKALAIQDYLKRFQYDKKPPAPTEGTDGVDYFLFDSKRGYCVQFASAMSVMLRSIGIPSRLSTGYLEGKQDEATGGYFVRASDYHARPEAYFPGYGWIEFEATPSSPPPEDDFISRSPGGFVDPPEEDPSYWMPSLSPGQDPANANFDTSKVKIGFPVIYLYLIGLAVILAAAIFGTREYFYWQVDRQGRIRTARQAYERMCRLANRGNSGPASSETPSEFGKRLSGYLPGDNEAITMVIKLYQETQYGPRKELDKNDTIRLQKAWVNLCPSLFRHMLRLKKWTLARLSLRYSYMA
jgi:transglutaminase-like putative cysteine protease